MKFEQKVFVKIVDSCNEDGDVYDENGIDAVVEADGLTSAEEGFMRGYLEEEIFDPRVADG